MARMRTRVGPSAESSLADLARDPRDPASTRSLSRVHFSSGTDEWPTPQWLFAALDREFAFSLDPCSTHENAKCARHFTRSEDGLRQSWAGEVVWMNPPYGRAIASWMAKAYSSARDEQATVVCLVPARTDTRWWHQFVMRHEIRFLRGRLQFGEARAPAPFPSALVVMRPAGFRLESMRTERPCALNRALSDGADHRVKS